MRYSLILILLLSELCSAVAQGTSDYTALKETFILDKLGIDDCSSNSFSLSYRNSDSRVISGPSNLLLVNYDFNIRLYSVLDSSLRCEQNKFGVIGKGNSNEEAIDDAMSNLVNEMIRDSVGYLCFSDGCKETLDCQALIERAKLYARTFEYSKTIEILRGLSDNHEGCFDSAMNTIINIYSTNGDEYCKSILRRLMIMEINQNAQGITDVLSDERKMGPCNDEVLAHLKSHQK